MLFHWRHPTNPHRTRRALSELLYPCVVLRWYVVLCGLCHSSEHCRLFPLWFRMSFCTCVYASRVVAALLVQPLSRAYIVVLTV